MQGPVDLKWACYILRIFCPTSLSQINTLCLEDFLCYSKIIYVRTTWNFSLVLNSQIWAKTTAFLFISLNCFGPLQETKMAIALYGSHAPNWGGGVTLKIFLKKYFSQNRMSNYGRSTVNLRIRGIMKKTYPGSEHCLPLQILTFMWIQILRFAQAFSKTPRMDPVWRSGTELAFLLRAQFESSPTYPVFVFASKKN